MVLVVMMQGVLMMVPHADPPPWCSQWASSSWKMCAGRASASTPSKSAVAPKVRLLPT
jgi:hypothetical protein